MEAEKRCENPECGTCHCCQGLHLTSECAEGKIKARLEAAAELAKACKRVMGASIVCPEDLESEVEQCREALLAWDRAAR